MTISKTSFLLAILFGYHLVLSKANNDDYVTGKFDPTQHAIPFTEDITSGFIHADEGTSYDINSETLKPYYGLFSPAYYINHGTTVTDTRTNQTIAVTVYRAHYKDGTFLQASKDIGGIFEFFEIRRRGFPKTQILRKDSETYITLPGIDDDAFNREYHYGNSILPPDDSPRQLRGAMHKRKRKLQHVYTRNDNTDEECSIMKVLKVAITFDAFFCKLYGSKAAAIARIQSIISGASEYFENDMCLRLELTEIHTADECTNTAQSRYKDMARDNPCDGSNEKATFLTEYANDMSTHRDAFVIDTGGSVQFDEESIIHHFTGSPKTGTLGCSFIGTACSKRWGYGVNYMATKAGSPQPYEIQEVLFAHELGHTIGMRHLIANDGNMYIMNPIIRAQNPSFHDDSIQTALAQLEEKNCGYEESTQNNEATKSPTPSPSFPPTKSPSKSPTQSPTSKPTPMPSKRPTLSPTSPPTIAPQPTNNPPSTQVQPTQTYFLTAPLPTRSPPPTNSPSRKPTPAPSTPRPTLSPTSPPTIAPQPTNNPPSTQVQITQTYFLTAPLPTRSPPPTNSPSRKPTPAPFTPPPPPPPPTTNQMSTTNIVITNQNAECNIKESGAISQAQCAQMSDKGKFACYEKASLLQAHVESSCNDAAEVHFVSWADEYQPRFLVEDRYLRDLKKDNKGDKQAKKQNQNEENGTSTSEETKNGKENNTIETTKEKSVGAQVVKIKKLQSDKCSDDSVIETDTLLCFSSKVTDTNQARVYTVSYNVTVRKTVTKLTTQVSILPEGAGQYENCGKSETACKNK